MEEIPQQYEISAKVWLYKMQSKTSGNWYFLTIPQEQSTQIKFFAAHLRMGLPKTGWGSVRVTAIIGETTWKTSIFPDKKTGTYILPIKAEVRKKEAINVGSDVIVIIKLSA